MIKTLREWNVKVDEAVFLGGIEKAGILAEMRPHIYFDDQLAHLKKAKLTTPSAHVLPAATQPELFPEASDGETGEVRTTEEAPQDD